MFNCSKIICKFVSIRLLSISSVYFLGCKERLKSIEVKSSPGFEIPSFHDIAANLEKSK